MAKLLSTPAVGEWNKLDHESFSEYMKRTGEEIKRLQNTEKVIMFPVADGYAYYVVVSEKPLTMQWVPYGDRWQVHPALIRGLTLKEVKGIIAREKAMRELFSRK